MIFVNDAMVKDTLKSLKIIRMIKILFLSPNLLSVLDARNVLLAHL